MISKLKQYTLEQKNLDFLEMKNSLVQLSHQKR
jgi:hypothetical protein